MKNTKNHLSHRKVVLFCVFYFERIVQIQCFAGLWIKAQQVSNSTYILYKDLSIKEWDSHPMENLHLFVLFFFLFLFLFVILKQSQKQKPEKSCPNDILGGNERSKQVYIWSQCLIHLNFKFPWKSIGAQLAKSC